MTTELVEHPQPLPEPSTGTMLAIITRAASDPAFDVEKLKALFELQRELMADQAAREYAAALNAAQAEVAPVVRASENSQTRSFYAKLEAIDKAIRPIYIRNGFSLSYNTVAPLVPGNIRIECLCSHRGGHTERYGREAPADTLGPKGTAVKTQLHGGASTETFLKRYLVAGIFNVVFRNLDEDDDGNAGGAEYIIPETVKEIETLLQETGADVERFLRFMKVDSIPQITVYDLPRAINSLLAKKRAMESEKAGEVSNG